MKKIILIERLVLFFFAAVLISAFLGISWSQDTVFSSCQPKEIDYKSFDPYCVSIIKQQQTFDSKYYILVAKEAEPSYGYVLNFPASGFVSEMDLKYFKINWTDDGIELETYLNTKIFIPKKNFIGGR